MAKKATGSVKLQIAAGKARRRSSGTGAGQAQVNIMEFCKQFNARTSQKELEGLIVPVVITVYSDRTFTFITKTPPASILLKRAAASPRDRALQIRQGRQGDAEAGRGDREAENAGSERRFRRCASRVCADGAVDGIEVVDKIVDIGFCHKHHAFRITTGGGS